MNPQTPLYVERFKQLYPRIQVHTYVAGCWQIYNRHTSERQAKRQAADVFFATEDVMSRMSSEHSIEAYRSPELVHFAPAAAPPGKDYLVVKTLIYGMASNREFTKGIAVPNDWLDYSNRAAAWRIASATTTTHLIRRLRCRGALPEFRGAEDERSTRVWSRFRRRWR
jgi:iron(III) transport system substrate-binding protein